MGLRRALVREIGTSSKTEVKIPGRAFKLPEEEAPSFRSSDYQGEPDFLLRVSFL